jgi:hypothetical protein
MKKPLKRENKLKGDAEQKKKGRLEKKEANQKKKEESVDIPVSIIKKEFKKRDIHAKLEREELIKREEDRIKNIEVK